MKDFNSNLQNVDKMLKGLTVDENKSADTVKEWSNLSYGLNEGFIPGFAKKTTNDLIQLENLGNQRYYIGESMVGFVPSYNKPYAPSYVRDEENFMPGFANSTHHAFNKLMTEEDQNYLFRRAVRFRLLIIQIHIYMRDWANQI